MPPLKETMLKPDLDINLHRNVVEELAFDPSIDERAIAVAVSGNVVTLRGFVNSYAQKLAAEKAVKRVRGVRAIAEELEIDLPVFHVRNDADLAQAALDALRWNVDVPKDSVVVGVEGGQLTLTGSVEWHHEREAAQAAVASLEGVRGVRNDIQLRTHGTVGDIAAKIRSAFERSAQVDADQVKIELFDDTVTLRGPVHSWEERADAESAAYSIPGVREVRNLTIIA
jgi:osmotically-inducible protein OsmY